MRIKCKVAYDGTGYAGYQVQPNKRTVQGEIEAALAKLHKGQSVRVHASGRTDAGVHAKGQVIHFDTILSMPEDRWPIALNSILPDDIVILEAEKALDDFHARYEAIGKEYRYFVHLSKQRDPFLRKYAYQFPYSIDISKIEEAAQLLVGTHDFTSFCSAKTEVDDKVRTLDTIELFEEKGLLVFRFVGNGFLYNMVRIIVGTLLEVGSGEKESASVRSILERKDRRYAGKTAPGHGLYLWEVFY
ncbi:tRNA pseudouridine(38-40) synthase TruA [Bacillus sp. B15-48]|uniref:tRNA pseudouridine(38-40) synthase TruA n=1 Tax=Bacillus sp. B15-48 TaxID=1548601 RepID=UPI00193F3E5E|nr:tRNA pseudouridine(38-40) synthase TruA [Bacillus sp. B15-48]MBM4764910.1 tRNA pseudouridine(38-40) synthase TruA [Bacillus sp. B15-48]